MGYLHKLLPLFLGFSAAGVSLVAAEYLPVCEKCLNPRVQSKTGFGTASAVAEAKVMQEDAVAWCAANRPRDPGCVREEVTNGGDGGRKSFKASADCSAGVLHSISGGDYLINGVWPDGPGKGRPRLKDPNGNVLAWNSVTYGRGIARSEWSKFAGYSLTGQWEVLCGGAAKPKAAAAPEQGQWLASCFRCPAPAVFSKKGAGTAQAVAEARLTASELLTSCAETDPNAVEACVKRELAESGKQIYRATADCTSGRITTIDEQQYTLAGVWDNSDIGGGRTKWRGADGQIVSRDNVSGGLAISQQWEVLCPGPVSAPLLAQVNARPQRAAPVAVPNTSSGGVRTAVVCAGKRYCDEAASFAAIIRDFRTSAMPDRTRMVSATVRFLNKSARPLILGYILSAGVAIDEQGNRYVLAAPTSVRGIGEITNREFDPKFTLQPGQTADARFEFVWRPNGREIIGMRAWDVELAVREVGEAAPGQYRFGQEHALQFKAVPPAPTPETRQVTTQGTTPLTTSETMSEAPVPAPVPETRADACAGKKGCYDAGNFVAEIRRATLTHEGTYQDRVARLDIQIRNTSTQPLILAYVVKSSVLIDDRGSRFFWGTAGTYDTSATGIGKVEGNKADPQFTLAPGESRTATFTLRRRTPRTDPDGSGYTYDVSLAQLDVLYNGQQIRTNREHSLSFTDFGLTMPTAGGAPPAAAPAKPQSLRGLSEALRRSLELKK
jgi:hypothetical protein